MPLSKFLIRFIRSRDTCGSGKNDDIATVYRTGEDQYKLSFTYGEAKVKEPPEVLGLSSRDVFRWMRALLGMLEIDKAPFANIQIDQPLFPSILIPVQQYYDINRCYHRVLDSLEFYLDTAFYADEEETETELEMPELLPMNQHFFYDRNGATSAVIHSNEGSGPE